MSRATTEVRRVESRKWTERLHSLSRQRKPEIFMELYDHFAPRVASYLQRLGADAATIEELTQETMLSVWRKAALFKPDRAAASTWIFTIARNQFIDTVRRQGPVLESVDDIDEPGGTVSDSDYQADAVPL